MTVSADLGQLLIRLSSEVVFLERCIKQGIGFENSQDLKEQIVDILKRPLENQTPNPENNDSVKLSTKFNDSVRGFGHLLYTLQREPTFLARLLRSLPTKSANWLSSFIISTLFPNPYSLQEEALLLNVIRSVLELDIAECSDISSFLRDNSASAKLISCYVKREPCKQRLTEIVSYPQQELLNDLSIDFEMNPDKIHVKDSSKTDTINKRSMDLIHVVNSFLDPFLASELPLGLRLLSKLLLNLALPHFDRDERQAHRIVGGLLFLRYYNPAIIDIVTSHPHPEFRSSRMRRNLILVAKVLQNLSNGVLFGDKEQYMSHLNLYLGKRSEDLFDFFHRTTDVFDLDENLSMHSPPGVPYKSVTYSSASEMLRFYDLLTEFTNINPRCAYSKSRILLSSDRDALCSITSLQLIKVDINNVEEEIDEKGKRDTIIDSIRLTGLPRLFYFILKTNFLSLYSFPTGVSVPQQCCDFFTLVSKFCRSQGNFDTAALYRQASDKFNDLCGDDSTCEDTLNSTLQVVADYINDRRRCLLFFQKENACLLSGLSSLQAQAEPLCSLSKSSNVLLGASLNQFLQPPTDMVDSAVLMGESGLIGSLLNRMIRIAASIRRKSSANFLDTLHDSDLLGYSLDLVRKLKVSGALLMIESIVKALNSSPQFVSCWTAQRFCLNIGVDASDRSEFLYFEKIFEYLSVEMILAVIPVLNNHAPEELQVSLVDLAFQSPLPVPHGSSPSRIQTLQQLIRERWRQVLTLIRPVSVMHIVGRFLSSPPSDLSSVLDCVSMLRFDVTSPLDVSALSLFLRRHLFILRSGFVSTEQMNLHLSSLCFSISNIDFVLLEACEDTELSISCFQDVSAIYFWFLNVLRDTSLDRRLINTLGTAVMRCAPAEFYQCHVEAFVFDHLIAHLFREKNLVALRLKSLCRFLCHEEKATRVLPARIFRTIADNLTTDNFKKCYHCIEELVDVIVALAGHQFDLTVRGLLSDMLRFRMFRRDSKPLFAVPPIQIFVGLQVLTRIVNDKYQFCDLASRIGPKSEGFKVDMISAVSSFFAPLIADIISICDREVGLKLTGMLSEQQVDLVESAPNYMGSITWERHDAWISIFSACINLCPDVMLDSFLSSSIRTYGVSGNSVIKLLLHSDKRIAQSAHCSLVRIVRQFPVERLQVLEGALVLFSDSLVQSSVGRQITLLSHLTSLLQCVRADDAFAEDFLHSPGFMSWRLSADAMVLLGLCSHHSSVRRASCELVSALGDLAGSSLSLLSFMKDDSVISASLKRNCDSLTSGASIHLFTTENTDRESVRRRRDALRILGSQCCEIPEYYNAILCLRRHLCSLLFDNDVSPNILEKSRSSMLILLFSIASPLESSVDDAVGFESICRPCRVITAEQSISKVFACPTLISAWTLSYMHWRSVGTVIRTILFQWNTLLAMDPARRHVTVSLLKGISGSVNFHLGLLEEDPGVFNSLTGFLLGALDADSSDIYRLVGLIHNYSTALVLIMESFRSHPNLDNIVDGHGHLRLFTKQHRQRALLLLKQYRDLDLDQNERCVQAASKLLMLGPVLTTTTMKSNDELLMWIFQFASSSILSRLMNYQWLALYPLYLLHLFDFPNILPAVADNIRTQSQLPKKHVGLLVTIMFSVIVSNTGDCVDHATSILNSLSRLFGATRTYNRAALHSTFLNVRLVAAISVAEAFANDLPREFHGDVAMSLLHRQKLFPRPCPFMAIWLPGIPSTEMPQFLDALTAYEERDENLAQIWIDLVHYRHESFSLILAAAVKRPSMLIAMFHAASNNQKEAFFDFLLVPVFCRISGTHSATTLPDSFSISLLIELLYIDGAIKLLTDAQLAAILFWVAVGDHASIARRLEIILDGKRTQIINQAENAWSILEHRIGATLIHCIGQHSLTYLSKHLQSEQCVVQSLRILLHRDAFTPSLDTIRGLLWCLLSFLDNMQYCKSDSIQFPVQLLQILGKSVNNETRSLLIRASVAILHCDNPLLYGQSLHILNECLQAVEREPQNFEHQYLLTVQPLLVYGFTNKVTEVASQDVLLQLSRAASNHLLGNGGEQCVAAIIYLLPWVISSYTSLKDQLIVDRIVFVMSKIAKLLSKSHRALAEIFMCELQNIESLSKNQQSFPHDSALFLTTVCRELIACCRGQTALFAEILYVMLQRGNDLHKSALFRISAAFLQHDYAYEFIDDFCDVIAFAKGLLSKETSTVSEDMMAGAMDVISSAIDVYTSVTSMTHKKSVMENRFFSSHSFEKALLELHKLMESECCLDSSKLFSK